MTTFAELQCFNKLLLDKMNRQEKEIKDLKKETERLKDIQVIYNSLEDALQHNGRDEIGQCVDCEHHFGMDEMRYYFDEHYCEDCIEKHNFVMCSFCGDSFDLDRPEQKELIVFDMDGDAYCTCHCCRKSYEETMEDYYRQRYNDVVKELNHLLLNKQFIIESNKITKLFIGVDVDENCECGENIHKGIVKSEWRCKLCDIGGPNYNGGLTDTDSDELSDAF